jgi:pyocin large subunit-like protein
VSFSATRWAWEQDTEKSSAKLVLLAMADCVNSEGDEMLCWPSYRFLAKRTGLDFKTVEAGVYRLREAGFISDTGARRGETGKVIVYRLNIPENGVVSSNGVDGGRLSTASPNNPENGGVNGISNDPVFSGNPPKFPAQSPQISSAMTPKTGSRTKKNLEGTRKESGRVVSSIPGVDGGLLADWITVRKAKLTETAFKGLEREAKKAGLTLTEAITACCEFSWRGFDAGWYAKRVGPTASNTKHAGFSGKNYREGVSDDGSFN